MKKCMPILAVFLLLFCMTMLTGCSSERGSVVINEVCADGKSSYRNENGDGTDWIELYNPGKKEISLKGYILTDKTDKMDYGCILPDLTLPAGGYLVLCAGGEQTDAFTLPFGISAKGESLYLKDASGKLLQSLTIPAMGEDVSYARRQDGSFGLCAAPTPGSENGTEILDSLPENPSGSRSSVTLSITEVATAGGETGDFVEIHNPTESTILLQGMHLTDDMDTPRKTTLGDISVPAGGYAVIYCGGENGVNLGLSRSGENLFLLDAYGALVDGVEIPALLAGQSWAKAAGGTFGYCGRPTPGSENTAPIGAEALVEADGTEPVILNEVLMKNRYSIVDTYGNHSDFVELYNAGTETVSLDGYYLTDDFSCPAKASLAGCSIGPGEYLVIFLSGMVPANGEQHVAFSLGDGDDGIMLYHGENRSFQKISFLKDVPEDVSISIGGDGKPEYHAYPTPGGPNATGFASLAAQGAGLTEGVYISEVSAGGTGGDWVEIGNGSMDTVDLTGWTVWDGSLNTQKCLALSGKLKAGEYLAINGNDLHISAAGDTVVLVDGSGNTRDSFATGDLADGITSGRSRGSSERRFYAKATRGGANGSGYAGYATVPFFSESGLYRKEPFYLTISCADPDCVIRYTTDGSEPTEKSAVYGEPIYVDASMTIRAKAFKSGLLPARTKTETYLFVDTHTLPVVTVSCDPAVFKGYTRIKSQGKYDATEAFIAYYEADGTLGTAFPCDIKPRGNMSLKYPQKSFSVHLRAAYGQKAVTYPFWGDGSSAAYSTLVLRNGSQDYPKTRFRDSFGITAARRAGLNVDCSQTRPVIVYVNGTYYGIMDLNEGTNQDYLVTHYGVDVETINQVGTNQSVRYGSNTDFLRVRKYARTHDFSKDAVFEEFSKWVDVDCVTDYLVAQTFFCNYDIHNQLYWATSDYQIRWRPVFYDIDRCFTDRHASYELFQWYFSKNGVTYGEGSVVNMDIYYALRQNPAWCEKFLDRYAQLLSTSFSVTQLQALVDEMADVLRPEMEGHCRLYRAPASVAEWEGNVKSLKDEIATRHAIIQKQLQAEFRISAKEWDELMQKYNQAA